MRLALTILVLFSLSSIEWSAFAKPAPEVFACMSNLLPDTYETEHLKIRKANPDDFSIVFDIVSHEKVVENFGVVTPQKLLANLSHPNYQIYLAYANGRVVGTIFISLIENDKMFLSKPSDDWLQFGYAVLPDYQRNGYGTEMVTEAFNITKNTFNPTGYSLGIRKGNEASEKIARRLGFVKVGSYDCGETQIFVQMKWPLQLYVRLGNNLVRQMQRQMASCKKP